MRWFSSIIDSMNKSLCKLWEIVEYREVWLAWKIPWMEEPAGLQSMGSLRVGHD